MALAACGAMVKGVTLRKLGGSLNLGSIALGFGEAQKAAVFVGIDTGTDAGRVVIGAIYLDSDFGYCQAQILRWF